VAFLDKTEVKQAYDEATKEADQWRKDYTEYERLADNGLMEQLDENLPEVNDGSLAASLFKLAKRVIRKKLSGRATATDTDDSWITEFANIQWEKKILKNANSMATPRRKWKDAVRKAAIYGGQPIITLFVDHGKESGADFIVPYAVDVKLEAGKVSDLDSDIIFWDIYYSKLQVRNMIEQAEAEMIEEADQKKAYQQRKADHAALLEQDPTLGEFDEEEPQSYNKWDVELLKKILASNAIEDRPGNEESRETLEVGVKKGGYHFYIAFQRGVESPFYMCHPKYPNDAVREWSNPDPTGDIPVHYLYCYQDFVNPYGIGIVKLAGGTQNVLDYMRQADILATQLGLRPPKKISGPTTGLDESSMVYAQDANWYIGQATVERLEMSNQVYQQLPDRVAMYQTSLQKMIPTGDTTISGESSGDPQVGKTPQALKMADASLSIDDEDFSENVDECYALVAKSMINTHFANMQGADLLKLAPEEQEMLANAGVEFPVDELGQPTAQFEFDWDEARAAFDFEIDPDADKTQDEEAALDGKLRAYEMTNADPNIDVFLQQAGFRLNRGELLKDIFKQLTDNDKIVEEISPEEKQAMQQTTALPDPATTATTDPNMTADPTATGEAPVADQTMPDGSQGEAGLEPEVQQEIVNVQAIMEQYEVPQNIALAMREAELQNFSEQEIMQLKDMLLNDDQPDGPVSQAELEQAFSV
jgi:hypothetical protein